MPPLSLCFFFNDTATTEIYTLSLHDALPILRLAETVARVRHRERSIGIRRHLDPVGPAVMGGRGCRSRSGRAYWIKRSEEHTSELQSLAYLVCRLLLEKKKNLDQGRPARVRS